MPELVTRGISTSGLALFSVYAGLGESSSLSFSQTTVSLVIRLTGRSGSSRDPTPMCLLGDDVRITERPIRNNGG